MITYRDIEILTKRADRLFDAPETADPINARLETKTGPFAAFAQSRGAHWNRVFPWACHSRAEVSELESFLSRRAGRFASFWSPTWSADLELGTNVDSGNSEITVRSSEFIQGEKHIAIITPSATYPFAIVGVVDNEDGTMTLTLDDTLAEDLNINAVMISFLKFVRLADDDVVIEFSSGAQCQASLPLHEIPDEAP